VFHPVRAIPARHDQPHRITVEHRQVRVVHRIGEHHFAIERVIDVERLDEVGCRRNDGRVETVELHLLRSVLQAGLGEHGFQRHAAPFRVAHRTVGELSAGDARLEESAAVPRALVDRVVLDRIHFLQIGDRKRQRCRDPALDGYPVGVGIDARRNTGQVIADEKRVVWRDYAFVEHVERRLELRRPFGDDDQRSLLRILDKRRSPLPKGSVTVSATARNAGLPRIAPARSCMQDMAPAR
jgi:hypothetical protein